MRGITTRYTRVAVACLLVLVLLAPTALASVETTDPSLWAEFVAWLEAQVGGNDANDETFVAWLMGRISVPGG